MEVPRLKVLLERLGELEKQIFRHRKDRHHDLLLTHLVETFPHFPEKEETELMKIQIT